MVQLNNKKFKNPVCTFLWQDAAYSYEKEFPKESLGKLLLPQLTTGFLISANDEDDFINVAMNVEYDEKTTKLYPLDGLLIPKKTRIESKKIGFYNK